MTVPDPTLDEQQYDAWQSEILAQMGITRWVRQDCPVKTFANVEDFEVVTGYQAVETLAAMPQQLQPAQTGLTSELAPIDTTPDINHPVIADDAGHSAVELPPASLANFHLHDVALPNDSSLPHYSPLKSDPAPNSDRYSDAGQSDELFNNEQLNNEQLNDELLTASFDVQAIVVGEWTLVVDSHFLQTDSRQQQLWQQIISGLKASVHFFNFPLLTDSQHLPKATVQLMSSYPMAVAGFSGFLYRINQGNPKVGALTPLPDCLDEQPIQRLPYLVDMLDDYRLKRQLWQLLAS
ncbi:hypothetical protein AFK20_06950 [Enhydrobacter aerosaccus]|uniref:Uncharacterized protein n=1 Tax=Enhydrobacter aerosaccus TaxID=225324 RepID=A0ABR5ILQ1_9HYPH|nr:hypothetical protein [Enhydrobacter aerosaccus]KND21938.1 hypothetical protein AFK20_06950 [Enhydrobacter aerosaccus]